MLEVYDKEGNLKQLISKEDFDKKVDKNAVIIDELPTDPSIPSFFLYVNKNITIGDVYIPQYSRGIYINYGASRDAVAIIVDAEKSLYLCFRNNGSWTSIRKI